MSKNKKTAVVTGAAQGLGLAISETLCSHGYNVIALDLNADGLTDISLPVTTYQVDLTHEQDVADVIARIQEGFGGIDVLVNNAGKIHNEPLVNISERPARVHQLSTFQDTINQNLITTFNTGRIVAKYMLESRTRGVIVNVSSISANGNAGQSAYAAAKSAVNALTLSWAQELGVFGIRCVGVAPGFIDTPSTKNKLSDNILSGIKDRTPLRRLGKTDEVCKAVIYAIENTFVNGTILEVDGGLRI